MRQIKPARATTKASLLTGLAHRPAVILAIDEAVSASHSVGLAVLDVDRFQEINETCGGPAGDRVLQGMAALLRQAPGTACRVSGDSFALLIPDVSLEQAFLRMEGLRAQVEGAQESFGLPEAHMVTVTIGVAQIPRDAKDAEGLWSAADAALLTAKEAGRNQVGLPLNEEMVMKSCYYPASAVRWLKALAERLNRKESQLLREALADLIRKYDIPRAT